MKKKLIGSMLFSISLTLMADVWAKTTIPGNASKEDCDLTTRELNSWFQYNEVTKKGRVDPANSYKFDDETLCNFYKWGAQMFLWVTNPVGNSFVFDGPGFFDVVHSGNGFSFQKNSSTIQNNSFGVRNLSPGPIDSTGQAGGGGVLLSQEDSLTYYGMSVNNIFAYYLTGQKKGNFDVSPIAFNFPTTFEGLEEVSQYVKRYFPSVHLRDKEALAIEIKTSWVDAMTVDDISRYLIITANVPFYNREKPEIWPLYNFTVTKELALVGLHVVGSVNGHPELVWSTFEHVNNAPDNSYTYTNTMNKTVSVAYDSSGDWTFMETGGENKGIIFEFQSIDKETQYIIGKETNDGKNRHNIQNVDLVRLDPWGGLPNGSTAEDRKNCTIFPSRKKCINKIEKKRISNATQLISVNSTVMTALANVGDVRANYFQVGGVWASGGVENIPVTKDDAKGEEMRGSLHLSNATMETYHQFSDIREGNTSVNCFSCHNTKLENAGKGIFVSHIFKDLAPLPIP